MNQYRSCPVCGRPYILYAGRSGPQDLCSECMDERRRQIVQPTPEEVAEWDRRRREHFNVHLATASKVFGTGEITCEQLRAAKAIDLWVLFAEPASSSDDRSEP